MSTDKTIRKFSSHEEQRAETYRYWQSRPIAERFLAVCEATRTAYAFKGQDASERSERTLTRVQRSRG